MNPKIFIASCETIARGWRLAARTADSPDVREERLARAARFERLAQLAETDLPAAAAEFADTTI